MAIGLRRLGLALAALALAACSTVPYTGRSQLGLLGMGMESKLGAESYAD